MVDIERSAIESEAAEIVESICKDVLDRAMNAANISEYGLCGVDLTDPESCITVAMVTMATE